MSGETYPEDWRPLTEDESAFFSKEFYREAGNAHPLFYERMWAIARCGSSDDVLFKIHDGQFAAIHLTWAVETTPNFPGFALFDSFDEWRKRFDSEASEWSETNER